MDIKIILDGHRYQHWPWIQICINGVEYFNTQVQELTTVEFRVEPKDLNCLEICMHSKNNDTQIDQQGNILADTHCLIRAICINSLVIDLNFFSQHNIFYRTKDSQQITNYLGKDGVLKLEFPWPLWKFWAKTQQM